jgi:predicted nuclease with RNAse H fold
MSTHFAIGWDVGGWNCDKNPQSRDSIVILDSTGSIVGVPWRNNLRKELNSANNSQEWIESLFRLCQAKTPKAEFRVTMAIDTPLGFSEEFIALVSGLQSSGLVGDFRTNPYLFRQTERHLFARGYTPMSAINHQIGSQATKGMHALAKFTPTRESCGVWTDGAGIRAIETYPSASRHTTVVTGLIGGIDLGNEDKQDALVCAAVAFLFETNPASLDAPPPNVPAREGWIWTPITGA